MARLDIGKGLDELAKSWGNLEEKAPGILKMGVYDGAHVVFEQLKANADNIPDDVIPAKYREALKEHLGSSSIYTENGYAGEAFTMAGYIEDKHRKGGHVAAAMIARSANSGTSFSRPTHWIDKAFKSAKSAAEEKIADTVDKKLQETFGGD